MDASVFTTVSLSALGSFILLPFVARSLLQRHRTGSTGWRGVSGSPGSAGWWAGVLIAGSVLWLLVGPLIASTPSPKVVGIVRLAGGAALFLAGLGLTLGSQLSMGDAWRIGVRPGERTSLCTEGPFAWSRNPIFTGMLLAVLGNVVWVPWTAPAWLGLAVAFHLQVRYVEEPHLVAMHGDAYRHYARHTGRFWPRIGRRTTGSLGSCSAAARPEGSSQGLRDL